MNPESIPVDVVRHALRESLPFVGIASIVLVAGLVLLGLAIARSRDRLLLWVGSFSTLYGLRLFVENDLVQHATSANSETLLLASLCLTYVIPVPYALFAVQLLGRGWKNSIVLWFWCEAVFAVISIPALLWTRQQDIPDLVNAILVVAGTMALVLNVLFLPRNAKGPGKALTWPLIIFGIFVLINNRQIRPGGMNVEPFGFLILLAGLGLTAIQYAMTRERKLMEVEQELTLARRIQASIIPESAPELPGLQLATRYQPMTSVAGDFFDFLHTSDTCLTVLVADVSGHGVPAALVSSVLKVCFAAQREHANDPSKVLAGLNKMLRGSLGGQYVTAACAAIDLSSEQLQYAGAGHPASLLLRSEQGEVLELAENGLFLGPFPQATYANMSAPFTSGDRLLLYTDGILEAATGPGGQEFGLSNLQRLFLEKQGLEPQAFIAQLFRTIETPSQQDDLTAVLIQKQGP